MRSASAANVCHAASAVIGAETCEGCVQKCSLCSRRSAREFRDSVGQDRCSVVMPVRRQSEAATETDMQLPL